MKESRSNRRRLLPADLENRPIDTVHYAIEIAHAAEGRWLTQYGLDLAEATEYVEQFTSDPELRRLGYTATARKFELAAEPIEIVDVVLIGSNGREAILEHAVTREVADRMIACVEKNERKYPIGDRAEVRSLGVVR